MTVLERRHYYYALGLNDTDIAKLQDVTVGAIRMWRQHRKLRSNEHAGGNRNPYGRVGKPKAKGA